MTSKIYKVFISSTFKDLEAERKTVINGLLSINCMPIAMEFFPASDEKPADLIRRRMSDCDYYILIIKGKYGSIDPDAGKSFTEMEYDYACANKIPVLSFLYADRNNLKITEIDDVKKSRQMLNKFISKANLLTTTKWTDAENLSNKISDALSEQFNKKAALGFIKESADDIPPVKTFDAIALEKEKTGYIKFLHLSHQQKTKNLAPRKRYIARLGKTIDVYDELILYSANVFSEEISGFERTDITSGFVDFNILHPFQLRLFNNKGVVQDGNLPQTFQNSSNVFVTASYFFNSFQKDQLFRITMEKFTIAATFIFDFTLLPGYSSFINADKVIAWIEDKGVKTPLQVKVEIPLPGSSETTPGIFWVTAENLKQGVALVFDFTAAISWNGIENAAIN